MTRHLGLAAALLAFAVASLAGQSKPRARDLGVPFDGTPGRYNAITDVAGVEVGHSMLIAGAGRLQVGKGPVRTGVTALDLGRHGSIASNFSGDIFVASSTANPRAARLRRPNL